MSLKAATGLMMLVLPAAARTHHDIAQPHTAAAVLATSEAWSRAEMGGDPTFVDWLLLPGYVSVGCDGAIHEKAAIVASARKHVGVGRKAAAAQYDQYRRAHPSRNEVKLFGDTAIASYHPVGIDRSSVNSSDVFVYRQGHWHAIYSQHSALAS